MPRIDSHSNHQDYIVLDESAGSSSILALALHRLMGWRMAVEMADFAPDMASGYFAISPDDMTWDVHGAISFTERIAEFKEMDANDVYVWHEFADEAALAAFAAAHDNLHPIDFLDDTIADARRIFAGLEGFSPPPKNESLVRT